VSTPETTASAETGDWTTREIVGGYIAAAAMACALGAVVYLPGRLGTAAIFLGLLAVLIGGHERRIMPVSLAVATVGWLVGTIVVVVLGRAMF
jgi:hypothetical protein